MLLLGFFLCVCLRGLCMHSSDCPTYLSFFRLPNAFALNSTHSKTADGSTAEGTGSPTETDTLKIEEVQAPATGTRKAKVLYDYDAADSSELSLLADEVRLYRFFPEVPEDHQFLIYSDQPIWHQQPCHIQSHLHNVTSPL